MLIKHDRLHYIVINALLSITKKKIDCRIQVCELDLYRKENVLKPLH